MIEAVFPDKLPEINHAITVDRGDGTTLVCEVQQHLGDDRLRAVAMDTTDGFARGTEVVDTGGPITVPVGEATLGRMFNLLGEPIDLGDPVETEERWPIHRDAPDVENLTPTTEILETGIKVVDLLAPYAKGGKVGLFGGAGVGKTVARIDGTSASGACQVRTRSPPVGQVPSMRATVFGVTPGPTDDTANAPTTSISTATATRTDRSARGSVRNLRPGTSRWRVARTSRRAASSTRSATTVGPSAMKACAIRSKWRSLMPVAPPSRWKVSSAHRPPTPRAARRTRSGCGI